MPRSKSVPSHKKEEDEENPDLREEIELEAAEEKEKKKKKKFHRSRGGTSRPPRTSNSIANRPEWNNDTHIDGYDDLDENGKVKRRGELHTLNGEKSKAQQEQINQMWVESLRGGPN